MRRAFRGDTITHGLALAIQAAERLSIALVRVADVLYRAVGADQDQATARHRDIQIIRVGVDAHDP